MGNGNRNQKMGSEMSSEDLIKLLTGPFGALILCVIALIVIGRWLGKYLPQWVERHLGQFDKLIENQSEDREMHKSTLIELSNNLNGVSVEVGKIKENIQEIKLKI
jgi:hypothetical protein